MHSSTFGEALFELPVCISQADSCFQKCMVDACDYVRWEAFWALRRHLPGGFLICQKIIILEEVNENHRIWASWAPNQLATAVKAVLIWMFVSCLTTAFDITNVGTNMTAAAKTILMWMLTLAAAVKIILIWMFVSCLTTAFDIANVGTNMTAAVKTVLMWMLTGRSGQNSFDLDVCWLSHDCIWHYRCWKKHGR